MKKKEEVAPMTVDAIVAKLKEIGDALANRPGATKDADTGKDAKEVRQQLHDFAIELEASFESLVERKAGEMFEKMNAKTFGERMILREIPMEEIPITIKAGLYRYVGGRDQEDQEMWGKIWCFRTILDEVVKSRREQLAEEADQTTENR